MEPEDQRFTERDWDYAVVLDACRFDAFKNTYSDYLEGELRKVHSPASATPEWIRKTFTGNQSMTYYSANPFINSLGMPISEIGPIKYDYAASEHIDEVIDLWNTEWDSEAGTVMPGRVTERVLEDVPHSRRTVVHYMQPHAPFIGRGKSRINEKLRESFSSLKNGDETGVFGLNGRMSGVVERLEETELAMKAGLLSSLDLRSLVSLLGSDTSEKLMEFHVENLEIVLEEVERLVEHLDGEVIVTSDHGEAFGENGVWEHHAEMEEDVLTEVPWLEVGK